MAPLPLEGVRVLELGNYMAGPFCGMLLADMGADVIKVENPAGGDYSRALGPVPPGSPDGAGFLRLNRGKRSLALDLKRREGVEAFLKLARAADVLIENLRPGTLDDLNVGHRRLARENVRLIVLAVSGFGMDERSRAGLDLIVQAESGLMSVTGSEEGEPVKVGVPIADLSAALYGALGVVCALRERERTGRGTLIDLAMLDAAVSLAVWETSAYWTTGEVPRPVGTAHRADAPYQAFRTLDGRVAIGATSPPNWSAFLRASGLERLADDERWRTKAQRLARRRELAAIIEEVTATRTTDDWVDVLTKAGVPCGRIRSYADVLADARLVARGLITELTHPTLGAVPAVGSPVRIAESPAGETASRPPRRPGPVRAGPLLGEHTRLVLREVGITDDAIEHLVRTGVAGETRQPSTA
jgi:crotonobetainyl-CoA:carnitine CoA-transferase CaiB-like acyl-CoA transferase